MVQGLTYGLNHSPKSLDERLVIGDQGYIDPLKRITFFEDFLGDTLNTDLWASAVEADGTDQSAIALAEAHGGTVTLSLGSTANDFANLASGISFSTTYPGRLDVLLKVTGAANAVDNLVVGMTDAKTESGGDLCTNVVTPAIVPTDFMGWIYELANGGAFWYYGTANNGTDAATVTTSTVSTSYQKLSVAWNADLSVDFYINDVLIGSRLNAYRTGVALCPIIAAVHIGGTGDPVITVDYVHISQERA